MLPYTFQPNLSIEVFSKTTDYFEEQVEIKERINNLSWIYHSLFNIIPITHDNFWSGHNFPYNESWEELQISYNLMCFGLYKQSMISLRNVLELGILSVYYNINDDGHNAVKKWLNSDDSKEADTPRNSTVWRVLLANENINKFQQRIDIRQKHSDLGYLHNYVHTKGHVFSNQMGRFTSNCQTFEPLNIEKWLEALDNIIQIVATLHLLKYPTAMVDYDYSSKFGVDIPSFPHLRQAELKNITEYLPEEYLLQLHKISKEDAQTQEFLDWIEGLPDMTEEDVDNQILEMDKDMVERQGLDSYLQNEYRLYGADKYEDLPDDVKARVKIVEAWAIENNFVEPQMGIEKKGQNPK